MGMDLFNDQGGYIRWSPSGWGLALYLAEEFGWVPAGTTLPGATEEEAARWDGGYGSNDEQCVSAEDAAVLAGACEQAVAADDFAERLLALDHKLFFSDPEPPPPDIPGKPPFPERPRFSEADIEEFREHLGEFAKFCREGSFQIG